jgi:isopentenyldiphosphate isomerase
MVKTKLINILGESYQVNFPNMGGLQDIEAFKIAYTNGKYIDMALSGLKMHEFMLDVTDAVSYFSVLIPDLRKNLEIKNWRDLDTETAKKLVKAYKSEFLPWFKPMVDNLCKYDVEESDDVSEQNQG